MRTAKKTTSRSAVKQKKVKKKTPPKHASSPMDKLTSNALKFIDQAADLLRKGVTISASQSDQVRHTTRKKAHALLGKAHTSLGEALDTGASAIHKLLGKI